MLTRLTGGTISLHVRAQNSGVMFSKIDDSVHLEVFELTPQDRAVLTTKGRLRRTFPGPAFSLGLDIFQQDGLINTIANTLAKMSYQKSVKQQRSVRRDGRTHEDTTCPGLITELLVGFFSSMGQPADVMRVWKNTREEVMWQQCLSPWRRSPLWLLIRVTMQLMFSRASGTSDHSRHLYKVFMLFFMAFIARLSTQAGLPSDSLYAMNAKMGRRLLKLDPSVDKEVWKSVRIVMQDIAGIIQQRWSAIIRSTDTPSNLLQIKNLKFNQDVLMTLPPLDVYLESLGKRAGCNNSHSFEPTPLLAINHADQLPNPPISVKCEGLRFKLLAFEDWVASCLPKWSEQHKGDSDTCGNLCELIRWYHEAALPFYRRNPEDISVMLLTILELWIACDASALHNCSLLQDYDPGIPMELLQSLLLPLSSQLERLLRAESYLRHRHTQARHLPQQIYQAYGGNNSFSVKFFNQSLAHRTLLRKLEQDATKARECKREELREKKAKYESLMQLHATSKCEFIEVIVDHSNNTAEQRHNNKCQRCAYRVRANGMQIDIHEWPLPDDVLEAQSTVFELKVPAFFGHWRDITMFLLDDVFQGKQGSAQSPQMTYFLQQQSVLKRSFIQFHSAQRISLLSDKQPHTVSCPKKDVATADENDICVSNGLQYRYYDRKLRTFVDSFSTRDEVAKACTYQLPSRSEAVQRFIFRPPALPDGPSHNAVIASQSDCPAHISLDEYKALCSIPLGHRIQWQNVLLQLSAPSIDFKKVETAFTILQSIHQAGPPRVDVMPRESHAIVAKEDFAFALLTGLEDGLQMIKENWESSQALNTFSCIALRVLSLNATEGVRQRCLRYLGEVRKVGLAWADSLTDTSDKTTDESYRAELLSKILEITLICVNSFNTDAVLLEQILAAPEDAAILIHCSITIQEGDDAILKSIEPMVAILHQRWKRLSYRCCPILAAGILDAQSTSLDVAIKKSWSAYQEGNHWRRVSEQVDEWLTGQSSCADKKDQLQIHFNLLTGELRVNGLPLARLPPEVQQHPTFLVLFGQSSVEVMPTSVQGMQYSGKRDYEGYTIHFGLAPAEGPSIVSEHNLLVQAVKNDRRYEFVPSHVLHEELPSTFVEDFVHFYDTSDDSIEFRPRKTPWASSPSNWRLTRAKSESQWLMVKGGVFLINVKSETARVLSATLHTLQDPLRIHITLQPSNSLEIDLPHIQLGFDLLPGETFIRSRQFRGMSIDDCQSLPTLVGLQTRLVLNAVGSGRRMVIVPEGSISYARDGDYSIVTIDRDSVSRVHAYNIDHNIGQLIDNGTLQSKLLLSYLHALTSFCLPDPLTYKTGTEQALTILNSAAVRSFNPLAAENIELLRQIAKLTPSRCYYPHNERIMQTIGWDSHLSFLAQHGNFYKSVRAIFDQVEKTQFLHAGSYIKPAKLSHVDPDLLERDCIRSSTFWVSGYGAEDHRVDQDVVYAGRDRKLDSERAVRTFTTSYVLFQRCTGLPYNLPSDLRKFLWKLFSRAYEVFGARHEVLLSDIRYDAGLLEDPIITMLERWCAFHRTLVQSNSLLNRFDVMIWLATLAFAEGTIMSVVQLLMSIYLIPEMAGIVPPTVSSFQVRQGFDFNAGLLRSALRSAHLALQQCPEANLPRLPGESLTMYRRRKTSQRKENQTIAVDQVVDALAPQWPCKSPSVPEIDGVATYLDMALVVNMAQAKFETWSNNRQLYRYLGKVVNVLGQNMVVPLERNPTSLHFPNWQSSKTHRFISVDDIFNCPPPHDILHEPPNFRSLLSLSSVTTNAPARVSALLDKLYRLANSGYEKKYVEALRDSQSGLHDAEEVFCIGNADDLKEVLSKHLTHTKLHVQDVFTSMSVAATSFEEPTSTVCNIEQRPRLSPTFFLQQLSRNRWNKISQAWQHSIIHYALAIIAFQQAQRLMHLSESPSDLVKEFQNCGHSNWNPIDHPETLLLEVESGIIIRDVQEEIARHMRKPQPAQNSVMQLNMGEGKSSVIVPMVAAALADGSRLVRVIVAKPQSRQMRQMLISKLGGLLDRQVYHMPFLRSLKLGLTEANTIRSIYQHCMTTGGVLLVQPEHLLSFKLMGLECLITGKDEVGHSLLATQDFLNTSSRDVVDESDENFNVKFELIYTMGLQRPVELGPERWLCIQQVLELIRNEAPPICRLFPDSIEVYEGFTGCFPKTRILRRDAEQLLFRTIALRLCDTGLRGIPVARQSEAVRRAVFMYITEPKLSAVDIAKIDTGFWTDNVKNTLLLLRGLIAGGVLAFAMGQKRWRVNYGLDYTRRPPTKLAVPYQAKDCPSLRSEFSHPDVVIILTSLSYYYGGLSDDNLFLAFAHLRKFDQADVEYQVWVKDSLTTLALQFRQLAGINIEDRTQCIEKVFPSLRHAKGVIDYFLAHIVFPKELKEFPHKLSASGWDIGQVKTHPTTGFSGTNDSRSTLPLHVKQLDLPNQKHTNALVLEHLLRPENTVLELPSYEKGLKSDAENLLASVTEMTPPTQVILDVGAQILELSNLEVAKEWLRVTPATNQHQAVVFFDESEELTVIDRKGRIEPLQVSPFANQLDACLVFLDEAHTRGTDLKLPDYYSALVTLGANLTKDRLVQGNSIPRSR